MFALRFNFDGFMSFSSDLLGQRKQRIEKLNKLKVLGIDPYPSKSARNTSISNILNNFDNLSGTYKIVAGRIVAWRGHGKLIFWDIADYSGTIQIIIRKDELNNVDTLVNKKYIAFENLSLLDIGDFVDVEGIVTKSNSGEISILAKSIRLLTKTLRQLPTKLDDIEERYRKRYIDLNVHPQLRERFVRRSTFWQAHRDFLNSKGFIEINTPVLEHTTGGADAKPFSTYFDALNQNFYLRISHELPLKKLIGAGYEKVYDIGPRFRNEGFSDEHLPEHIAMEWYWAYADFKDGMQFTKELFRYVIYKVYGKLEFNIRGFNIDLSKEWDEIDYVDIIKFKLKVDVIKDPIDKLCKVYLDNGGFLENSNINRSRIIDNLWKLIRKNIPGPAFLVNVPVILSPLAKKNLQNPEVTERFHPIIAGTEMGNAFSELNDPIDQFQRFVEQQKMRESGDEEAQMMDLDFVEMLEYGMPPAVGYGHSERVFWIFEEVTAKDGVPFPPMAKVIDELNAKIYTIPNND